MAKTRQQKQEDLQKVIKNLKDAKSAVVAAFDRVTVSADQALRSDLREGKVVYSVVKKTLLKKALAEAKLENLDISGVKGNLGVAIGEDEVAPAKVLHKFASDHEGYELIGGWLEGESMDSAKIQALAVLPGKSELVALTLRTIKAPISGFVNVLGGTIRNLVYALNAVKDFK